MLYSDEIIDQIDLRQKAQKLAFIDKVELVLRTHHNVDTEEWLLCERLIACSKCVLHHRRRQDAIYMRHFDHYDVDAALVFMGRYGQAPEGHINY